MSFTAPELLAVSYGMECKGSERCHWCESPCERRVQHDDMYPQPFSRIKSTAKNVSGNWVCRGCQLFRSKSQTAFFLAGALKEPFRQAYRDRQKLAELSFLITQHRSYAIEEDADKKEAYKYLLQPNLPFCLMLKNIKDDNLLHLAEVNDPLIVKAGDPLKFNFNNVTYTYTVYELEQALKTGPSGKSPGVRMLVEFLGEYELPIKEEEKKSQGGRPKPPDNSHTTMKKVVAK